MYFKECQYILLSRIKGGLQALRRTDDTAAVVDGLTMHSRKRQFLNATQALRWMRNWIFDRISNSSQWSLNIFVSQSKYMYIFSSVEITSPEMRTTQKRFTEYNTRARLQFY